jgi:hypothetical protein
LYFARLGFLMVQIAAALSKLLGMTRELPFARLHSSGKRGKVHFLAPEDIEFLDSLFKDHPTGDDLYRKVKDNLNFAQDAARRKK